MSPTPQLRIVGLGHLEGPVREGSVDLSRKRGLRRNSREENQDLAFQKTSYLPDFMDYSPKDRFDAFK